MNAPAAYPQAAYRQCELITRTAAANFYYGIRLLPPRRRAAMCAVYAFARRVDDIGDGALESAHKLDRLAAEEHALAQLPACGDDPVLVALADAYQRFAIPPDALPALIAGVRMDVEGARFQTFDELVVYCRRVAGAIGRACLAIFALRAPGQVRDERAWQLADDLGVALQLTNILRDVREDADRGRSYLPAEELTGFGVIAAGQEPHAPALIAALARGARTGSDAPAPRAGIGQLEALMRFEAARARAWFECGIALTALLDRRSAACVLAMAGIYGRLLERIEADPRRALSERARLAAHEKAWVAARSLIGAATGLGARGPAHGTLGAAAVGVEAYKR